MLDHPLDRTPTGQTGWTRFLDAVYAADPNDESEWVEYKANVDPTSKPGYATLAKAIVAFANRDPVRAQNRLAGEAIILVGLEPGNLIGAPGIDPADLHNGVDGFLAGPAPAWEPHTITYRGSRVIAVVVAAPRDGDPIACISKNSDKVADGDVYVRRPGKSEPAKSGDIRRLTNRAHPAPPTRVLEVDVDTPLGSQPVAAVTRLRGWFHHYLDTERQRLAIRDPQPTAPRPSRGFLDIASASMPRVTVSRPEPRSPEGYQNQVDAYLRDLHNARDQIDDATLHLYATRVELMVTNPGDGHVEDLEVRLQLPAGTRVYDETAADDVVTRLLPDPPRPWGPRPMDTIDSHHRYLTASALHTLIAPAPDFALVQIISASDRTTGPRVIFSNTTLRPRDANMLDPVWLITDQPDPTGAGLVVEWSATAANIDGVQHGAFTIPTTPTAADLIDLMPDHTKD